jgi:hypothetical protein
LRDITENHLGYDLGPVCNQFTIRTARLIQITNQITNQISNQIKSNQTYDGDDSTIGDEDWLTADTTREGLGVFDSRAIDDMILGNELPLNDAEGLGDTLADDDSLGDGVRDCDNIGTGMLLLDDDGLLDSEFDGVEDNDGDGEFEGDADGEGDG